MSSPTFSARLRSSTDAGSVTGERVFRPTSPCMGDTRPLPASLRVEVSTPLASAPFRADWLDLARRAIEPNVFLHPDIVVPAAQHLAVGPEPILVLVWREEGPRRLLGLCALAPRRHVFGAVCDGWSHPYATLGTPLLDPEHATDAWRAILGWARGEGIRALILRGLVDGGPVAQAAQRATAVAPVLLARWSRALLEPTRRPGPTDTADLSTKGAKEARRLRRRLAEQGSLALVSARSQSEVRAALERFLALEARGWKGRAGTALVRRPGTGTFARVMIRLLAAQGLVRIDALTLDGTPIAMAVVLREGRADYLWKIAYDEDWSRFSPGVQLVLALTERQLLEPGAVPIDSCAIPDHPMIDRLWGGRLRLCDLALPTGPERSFATIVEALKLRHRMTAHARRALSAVVLRLRSWARRRRA